MFKTKIIILSVLFIGVYNLQASEQKEEAEQFRVSIGKAEDNLISGCKRCKNRDKLELEDKGMNEFKNHYYFCKDKELSPGALVCNGSENNCVRQGETIKTATSLLFSIFCDDHQDEKNLYACKDCQ